jgi:Zn-dependent metalloprotease
MKPQTDSFLFILICFLSPILNAQNNDTLDIFRNEKGVIQYVWLDINENSTRFMTQDAFFLKSILKTNENDEFKLISEEKDESGVTHKRFQQYYKGIKVEYAQVLLHGKNNFIEVMNGDFQLINIHSVKPILNANMALEKSLKQIGATKYKWEDPRCENNIKLNTNDPNATYYPKAELVISKDNLISSQDYKLAWKFIISSLEPDNDEIIFIDANTGDIINRVSLISDGNTIGTAQTKYSGSQNITTDSYPQGYRLQEIRDSVHIYTKNLNHSTNLADTSSFSNSNNNWTNENWSTFSQDQWALDAHWASERILDFWRTVFTRKSFDNNGQRLLSFIHYGNNWANAQWIGGPNNNYIRYGDGNSVWKPVTSLDICAHEFAHGVDDFTACLIPGYTESGALREGFADIWSACTEHWVAPNKSMWLIGEELFTSYTCLRNLQNPKSTSAQEGQHPDTYQGSYWDANGEPHCNSTVLSHWFYLLAQGGSGINDLGNYYNVYGLGLEAAQKIAYKLEKTYLFPSANYTAAKNSSITASNFFYGSTSSETMQVKNAWYAVGIGTNPTQYNISGDYLNCFSSKPYTLNNMPPTDTIYWTCSSNMNMISNQGSNPCYFQGNSTGAGWIRAKIITKDGTEILGPLKSIWVGKFENSVVTGTAAICPNSLYTYTAQVPGGHQTNYSYSWTYPSNWTKNGQSQNTILLQTPSNPYYGTVRVSITNECGTSGYSGITVYPKQGCGSFFILYPNPASDNVTITINEPITSDIQELNKNELVNNSVAAIDFPTYTIRIYNNSGTALISIKGSSNTFTVPLVNIKDGIYIIEVCAGYNCYREQLIVSRK